MSILGGDRKKPDAIQPFFVSFLECLMTRKGEEGEIDEVQDTVCICFTFSLPDRPLYTFSIKKRLLNAAETRLSVVVHLDFSPDDLTRPKKKKKKGSTI